MGKQSRSKRGRAPGPASASSQPAWTPFGRATVDGRHVIESCGETYSVFKNSRYTVLVRNLPDVVGWPSMIHLSIKRNDRQPVTSWRDVQKIKNELVGPEHEAVQLFPAESRLLDSANQYHLYVLASPQVRFPFGYVERIVSESSVNGSVQEPFEPHVRPPDLIENEDLAQMVHRYFNAQAGPRPGPSSGDLP